MSNVFGVNLMKEPSEKHNHAACSARNDYNEGSYALPVEITSEAIEVCLHETSKQDGDEPNDEHTGRV